MAVDLERVRAWLARLRDDGSAVLGAKAAWSPLVDELDALDFEAEGTAFEDLARRAFGRAQVDASHPRYFGPAQGTPSPEAVLGAMLAASFDPQLATHHLAPFAVRAEDKAARLFAERLMPSADGVVTSGASESFSIALLRALQTRERGYEERGHAAFAKPAVVYASLEAHASIAKALSVAGMGRSMLRSISVDAAGRMRTDKLAEAVGRDRAGHTPLLIVATLGSSVSGAFDPIEPILELATREGCAVYCDAALGGMLALTSKRAGWPEASARADALAFDPHKSLDVPLGCGLLLARAPSPAPHGFAEHAGYLPRDKGHPFAASLLWSRGFRALPLLMALAARGFEGVARAVDSKLALGHALRDLLRSHGFEIVNDSPLPVVCFVDGTVEDGATARHLNRLARGAAKRAGAYVFVARRSGGGRALRACITSERTARGDIEALVRALVEARLDVD